MEQGAERFAVLPRNVDLRTCRVTERTGPGTFELIGFIESDGD
jgi:hypothetical protein